MHCVVVFFGTSNVQRFLFKEDTAAQSAHMNAAKELGVPGRKIEISDDFGTKGAFVAIAVTAVTREDLSETAKGGIELAIHNERVQQQANEAANKDSTLRGVAIRRGLAAGQGFPAA